MSQSMEALAEANRVQTVRASQRRALIGQPPEAVRAAIIDPPPEFATYKLRMLFSPSSGHRRSVMHRTNAVALRRALTSLAADRSVMRHNWHAELQLRDLTRNERMLLVDRMLDLAPAEWRAA